MSARETYRLLRGVLAAGPAAVATVVRTRGSTPREVGAKMVIDQNETWGTIGGGCGEAEAIELARNLLASGTTARRMVRVDLTETAWETSDRICGGIMDVLVESWNQPPVDLGIVAESDDLVRVVPFDDRPARVWTPDRGPNDVRTPRTDRADPEDALASVCEDVWRSGRSRAEKNHFYEVVSSRKALVICGAGHIAQPLAGMASLLDLSVIVIDDRPDFARVDRFPTADRVIAGPFVEALSSLTITKNHLAVLVTRGHRHDEACLRELLRTDAGYIGMLGSVRRVRAILDELRREGVPSGDLDRIWAPIGLDIGANSPAEIAVAILAEITSLLRERVGEHPHLRRPMSSS